MVYVFIFTQDILEIMKETSDNEEGAFWEKLCSSAQERMIAKRAVEIMMSKCLKKRIVFPNRS